jgi:error-prone DNA polymerase
MLVRQRPGSANNVTFVTMEDETGITNLVVCQETFERQRRVLLGAGMLGCRGKVKREGDVIHVIADRLVDYSALLRSVAGRDGPDFPPSAGRGDQFRHPGGPDSRDRPMRAPRDIYIADLRLGSGIKVPTRDFR